MIIIGGLLYFEGFSNALTTRDPTSQMSYYTSSDFDPHAACESRETFLYSNTLLHGRQCSYDGDNNVEECYVDIGACNFVNCAAAGK